MPEDPLPAARAGLAAGQNQAPVEAGFGELPEVVGVAELEAWTYRSLSVSDDGLVLQSWHPEPNPAEPSGYSVSSAGPVERIPQRFDLPALWYSADGAAFGEGDLPHLGLAHQYLNHYRCRSEHEDLLSRTALPVGVRTVLVDPYGFRKSDGADGTGASPQCPQRLVLSSSWFMDLPEGSSFGWVNIEARPLAEHRAYLQQLEEAMRRSPLSPALAGGPARTELEVSLAAGQSYAVLQSLAAQNVSLCSSLLRQWTSITAEPLCEQACACLEVTPLAPLQKPIPTEREWLQLHERGVVDTAKLLGQLGLEAP